MSSKEIKGEDLSETLHLSECRDGFWLRDKLRGMNVAMRAETKEKALLKALSYYQHWLKEVESEYGDLKNKVDTFVGQFIENDETED